MDELCLSFTPHCFSLDDILASNEKISCVFVDAVSWLGFLDGSTEGRRHIAAGTKLELPLWLARFLNVVTYRQIVRVAVPAVYRQSHRHTLEAGAEVVSLVSWAPHYYLTGQQLLRLRHSEGVAIANSLVETLRSRLRPILDAASQLEDAGCAVGSFTHRLDALEKGLLAAGKAATVRHHCWMSRQMGRLETDANVVTYRKRKADHLRS